MLKLFLTATITLIVTLATLTACSDTTPAPEEVPTPIQVSSGTAASASTDASVSTETPAERPTAAPKATPASTPTPGPTATPAPPAVLAPLQALDISALLSELSANELACIGDDAGKLVRSLAGLGQASGEEQAKFFGCLEDETVARIFLAGFAPGPGPLSLETSDCVRAGFAVIDPREVMTAGIEGDPGRAMAGSMAALSVTIACLNDQEWEATASQVGMGPSEREGMRCLLAQLSGPGKMAEAMIAAGEGDFTDLSKAGAECGLDMGPAPGQTPVRPPPTPTGTPATPTPAPEPTVAPPVLQEAVAGGGDLPSAVEAVAPVPGVRVLQVLGHQLQALLAAGYLVGFISVDGEGRLVAAEGPVAGPVVDDVLLRRAHGRRLVPVVAVVEVFRGVVEVAAGVAEGELCVAEESVEVDGLGHGSVPPQLPRLVTLLAQERPGYMCSGSGHHVGFVRYHRCNMDRVWASPPELLG